MERNATPILSNILLFARALNAAGINVTPTQSIDFCRALKLVDVGSRDEVFHAARAMLINRREQLALFETLFNLFWQDHSRKERLKRQKAPLAPRHKRPQGHQYAAMLMARAIGAQDKEIEMVDKAETYSNLELLQRKDFGQLTAEELETIRKLIQKMRWEISLRETRRRVSHKNGRYIDLRNGMRSATKYGGVPLSLFYQRRKIKERPIILLADISGSMEKYSRLFLQFFYSVTHSAKAVEAFLFGTRLSRITNELQFKNIDTAIDQTARHVIDWNGGTRIGQSLAIFNRDWSRRVLRRGAIVILVSDGWERGDSELLSKEMRYLQHRSHRLIWLNPLSGRQDYQPKVEGMAAALPYVDDFMPIHNLQSLQELAEHLEQLR